MVVVTPTTAVPAEIMAVTAAPAFTKNDFIIPPFMIYTRMFILCSFNI